METYLDFLTVIRNSEENGELDVEVSKMIGNIRNLVKTQKSVQKDVDLVYIVDRSDYQLPKQFSEDKTTTKWEAFAVKKGIKKRKSRMVYDEELNKYIPRYGPYSKKNLIVNSVVIEGEKTFSKLKKEKKKRVEKNKEQMLENRRRKFAK
ncbi:Ribosome biogenesis regulatory like protein [Nosema granulosis]|uniref:Ribosome biogenesis regulatory protein n=1 Tax=Nosema granulosis TaxID=83296 RepID=A0A9P6GZB9_9MICR|nr:Ribosome biogenesis regulatory like protein [Nosema granulosis]